MQICTYHIFEGSFSIEVLLYLQLYYIPLPVEDEITEEVRTPALIADTEVRRNNPYDMKWLTVLLTGSCVSSMGKLAWDTAKNSCRMMKTC